MTRRSSIPGPFRLLAVTILTAAGLAACGDGRMTDAARLARGKELVQQMSARLATASAITLTTREVREVVRASGRKEPMSQTGVYTMRRPDRFHAKMTGSRDLEVWYNGRTITLASHPDKVFAQAPMPETTDRTFDALAERYDVPLPMADLFYSSAVKALLSDTTTGGYVGTENVGDTPCVHLAFKDIGVEWDLWLPAQGDPLPVRFKTVQTKRTGQPTIDVLFTAWDFAPPITDATFVPKLPAEYEGIALLQRAAAIKTSADSSAPPSPAPK